MDVTQRKPPEHPAEDDGAALLALARQLASEIHPGAGPALGLSSSIEEDAGFDSMARVELLERIRRRFGVTLPDRDAFAAESLNDLLKALARARAAAKTPARASAPGVSAPAGPGIEAAPPGLSTLAEILAWHAERHPDREHILLLEDGERASGSLTYGALLEEARRFASSLAAMDLGPRPAVAIMLPTSRAFFTSFAGTLIAGGIPVPLYPPFRPSQIGEHLRRQALILRNAECRLLVTVPEAVRLGRLLKAQVPGLREVATPDGLAAGAGAPASFPAPSPGDLALLQYTSGSTGDPKGVALTHANLLANIRAMGSAVEASPHDVFVSWLPLYHDMGLIGAWMGALTVGFRLVAMSPAAFLARPSRWLRAIHRHGGTLSAAPNFAYEICATRIEDAEIEGLDLRSWRRAFNGAEPVSPSTLETFLRRYSGHGFRPEAMAPVYGLAENAVGLAFPPLDRPPRVDRVRREPFERDGRALPAEASDESALLFVSSGLPLPGHEIRVAGPAGRELPDRVQGRIQFRGPSATRGYYRNPEASRSLFRDGWLETGDLGYMAESEVFVSGRVKDVIIRGGRHFFPYEIEQAVGSVPGIRKGGVAAFGVTDPRLGTERLVVAAEIRGTAEAEVLRRSIAGVTGELLGAPADEILLLPPRSVPKTSSGKLRRNAVRDLYRGGKLGRVRPVRVQVGENLLRALAPELRRGGRRLREAAYAAGFWGLFGLFAPAAWIAAALPGGLGRRRGRVKAVAESFFRAVRVPIAVDGLDRLPAGPALLVANHPSWLDGLLLTAALPPRFATVAKSELRRNLFTRRGLQRLGAVFVDRFDPERGAAALDRLAEAVAGGQPLVIFAEGAVRRAPGIHPFHMGAFLVAARTGAPLAPVAISGSRVVLRGGQWFPRQGRVRVAVLPPLDPAGPGWSEALELRDKCRRRIAEALAEPLLQ